MWKILKKSYGQVESSIRNWNLLNFHQESYGTFLVHWLSWKLPSEIRLIIARKVGEEIWIITL